MCDSSRYENRALFFGKEPSGSNLDQEGFPVNDN